MNPYSPPCSNGTVHNESFRLRNLILQMALGAAYVASQVLMMRLLVHWFGSLETDHKKIFAVATTTAISIVLVFFIKSRFGSAITSVSLGVISGLAFFVYAYLVATTGDRFFLFYNTLMHKSSLINLLLSVVGPMLVGAILSMRSRHLSPR